jgi:hypothetical protein
VVHLRLERADRRAVGRGVLVAAVVWLVLSVEIVLTNVVFPSRTDDDVAPVLVSYLCVFGALFLVGVLAARGGAGRTGQLLAGLLAGALIGALTIGTFFLVDNVWLDIVARQQAKIDGLAQSGGGSMRAYINHGLIGAAVFLTLVLAAFGTALSWIGGAVRDPRRPAA